MIDDLFDSEELPNERIYRTAQQVVKDLMNQECKKIEWVAAQLGTTKGYLYASIDPHQTHKPLSVDRAIAITRLSGDMRIVEEMAREFGYTLCRPDVEREQGDAMSVAVKTLEMEEKHGELATEVKEAIRDGVLDGGEKQRIRDKAYQLRKLAASLEEMVK